MLKQKTNGKIKIGKINPNIYNGLNMIYNTVPEYDQTVKLAGRMKSGMLLQKYMYGYFEQLLREKNRWSSIWKEISNLSNIWLYSRL